MGGGGVGARGGLNLGKPPYPEMGICFVLFLGGSSQFWETTHVALKWGNILSSRSYIQTDKKRKSQKATRTQTLAVSSQGTPQVKGDADLRVKMAKSLKAKGDELTKRLGFSRAAVGGFGEGGGGGGGGNWGGGGGWWASGCKEKSPGPV